MKRSTVTVVIALLAACRGPSVSPSATTTARPRSCLDAGGAGGAGGATGAPSLPLVLVADVALPGRAVRFDYQELDVSLGHLVIAHMNDASILVVNMSDGAVVKVLPGIPTARGVSVAADVGRIFVTSSPNRLVIIDNGTLAEIARVDTGNGPDGVAWDPVHRIVVVSDQRDGAISLIRNSGSGARTQVRLGTETGNVVFDTSRALFWITVVAARGPNQLLAVDPITAKATLAIPLPGCEGAHGLRLHPNHESAFIACEDNSKVMRVGLGGAHALDLAPTGANPDVLAIDPGLDWLYVAAESGDLVVFDVGKPGLVLLDSEHPGDSSHSVAVEPSSHRVFFPLVAGPKGTPVLRIMRPAGT